MTDHRNATGRFERWPLRPVNRRGFTLVEMTVVLGIIIVLLGVTVPSISSMWNERKISGAQITLESALMIARQEAMAPGRGESGLLFMLDQRGVQHAYPIEQRPAGSLLAENRFEITDGRVFSFPAPMRVMPRYAVEPPDDNNPHLTFEPLELASNSWPIPSIPAGEDWQEHQRHRNYFTMVFSSSGRLIIDRDVLIYDPDVDLDGLRDHTGIPVPNKIDPTDDAMDFYPLDREGDPGAGQVSIDQGTACQMGGVCKGLPGLFVDNDRVALNFGSVDGLLLYDDSLLRDFETPLDKVTFIRSNGIPFYLAGLSGKVIRGPVGEVLVAEERDPP